MADDPLTARVATILDSLQSLVRMAPGMPVRAEDWNTVVGALIDVARLLTTQAFTAPVHNHVGLVSREWLDPSLIDFVDTTREQQQAQADQIKVLKQRVDRVDARIDAIEQRLGTVQSQSDREADAALDRDILLKRMAERVDGHDVLGSRLGDLVTRIGVLEPRIDDAVSLRRELTGPNGTLPDFAELASDVQELASLRDNLRIADGSLGRLRDLERRLDTFEQLGTNEQLLAARIESGIQDSLATRGLDAPSLTGLIDGRIAAGVQPVSTTLGELSTSVSGLQAAVSEQAGSLANTSTRIGALEAFATTNADLRTRVAALDAFSANTSVALAALRTDVDSALVLRDEVSSLSDGLTAIDTRLASFALETDLSKLRDELSVVANRTGTLEEQSKTFATREDLASVATRLDQTALNLATVSGSVQLLESSTANFQRVTSTQLQTLDSRVGVLTETNSKLATDFGKLSVRVDTLRPIITRGTG